MHRKVRWCNGQGYGDIRDITEQDNVNVPMTAGEQVHCR